MNYARSFIFWPRFKAYLALDYPVERVQEHPWHVTSWAEIEHLGAGLEPETFLVLRSYHLGSPADAGFYWLPGYPKGTLRQWRRRLPDDSGVHVYIYDDRLVIHRDRIDPSAGVVRHMVADCPNLVSGIAMVGIVGLLGAALSE